MDYLSKLIKRDWYYLIKITVIFIAAIMVGSWLPELNPSLAKMIQTEVLQRFSKIAQAMKNGPLALEIFVIFTNNMTASITAILSGIIIIPIFPFVMLIGNGVVVGLFQRVMETKIGLNPFAYYSSLLPHGLFELPAFFIAVGLGIRLGLAIFGTIRESLQAKNDLSPLKKFFQELPYYLGLIAVLLLVAAAMEVTVSPLLLQQKH